jgi:hypothetical protein
MNERIEKAKKEARQKEALLEMLEAMFHEVEQRKDWYCCHNEDGERTLPDGEWQEDRYWALHTIEAHLAKLI